MKNLAKKVLKVAVVIVLINLIVNTFMMVIMPMLGEGANMLLGLIGYIIGLVASVGLWFVIIMIPAAIVFLIAKGVKRITSK